IRRRQPISKRDWSSDVCSSDLITSCTCPRSPAVDSPLVASTDFTQEIPNLRSTLSQIEQVTDVEALDAKIADLEQQATAQDLWDDVDNAQQVTSALSHAHSERRRITELTQRIDDLEVMGERAPEEDDADTLAEAEAELSSIHRPLDERAVRPLLSGEYDERNAVITVRAGAGGVGAADFAEMLMRMYLRWAENRGYSTKVMDTSYAEEAGLKSVTFEISAPFAYGTLSVEGGTHRLVRI